MGLFNNLFGESMSVLVTQQAPDFTAAAVLANGSMSSNTSNEGEIRKNIVEADLVGDFHDRRAFGLEKLRSAFQA